MDPRETGNEAQAAGTPEDVAALYSWANLDGAKYRDFSASRREYRAQIRYRAAQALRERELKAQAAAEASAVAAESAALAAESAARTQNSSDSQVLRVQALRNAEAAARKAAAERVEASRRADAAAHAGAIALREEREIAEAHASAQRQASSYEESEMLRRQLAGPQPLGPLPGETSDPYTPVDYDAVEDEDSGELAASSRQFLHPGRYRAPIEPANAFASTLNLSLEPVPWRRPQGYRPDDASGVWRIHLPAAETTVPDSSEPLSEATEAELDEAGTRSAPAFSPVAPLDPQLDRVTMGRALERMASGEQFKPQSLPQPQPEFNPIADLDSDAERTGPAWLYSSPPPPPRTRVSQAILQSYVGGTLQDSRERVASRWFALKGLFDDAGPELPTMQPPRPGETRAPLLLVFSLAGGVGKTSLVATLGRALSSQGEKVLLADTTSHGLLPFYFGASELRPGVMRTFSPPAGSGDAPIYLVSYDVGGREDDRQRERLMEEIFHSAQESNRVVLDLSAGASWLIRRMAGLNPTVLVPVAPDMTSVISLHAIERFFQGIVDSDGRPLLPFYVLNQFDATLPLHLDVREVFRRQLGDRLLNFVIRRSPAVSEALAEGMTVVDYAAAAPVSKDYFDVAAWLRGVSPPAATGIRNASWSER